MSGKQKVSVALFPLRSILDPSRPVSACLAAGFSRTAVDSLFRVLGVFRTELDREFRVSGILFSPDWTLLIDNAAGELLDAAASRSVRRLQVLDDSVEVLDQTAWMELSLRFGLSQKFKARYDDLHLEPRSLRRLLVFSLISEPGQRMLISPRCEADLLVEALDEAQWIDAEETIEEAA